MRTRLDGCIGVYARPGGVEVQARMIGSWAEADEIVRQVKRAARKAFGTHPNTNTGRDEAQQVREALG